MVWWKINAAWIRITMKVEPDCYPRYTIVILRGEDGNPHKKFPILDEAELN